MEIKAQAAMLLTLVEVDGKENVRASVLEGTDKDLNDTARDMAGVLVAVANNPKPPFDPDPKMMELESKLTAATSEVERLKEGINEFIQWTVDTNHDHFDKEVVRETLRKILAGTFNRA